MQKSRHAKINEKFRSDYLAVNIRETDIYEEGRTEGIALGISQGISQGIAQGISHGIAQGISQGISQGAEQKAIETVKQGLILNLSYEQISQLVGLPLEIVEQLAMLESSKNNS